MSENHKHQIKSNIIAKKSLGQNFLIDSSFLKKIASLIKDPENQIILEIGPGTGNLTRAIMEKKVKKLIAIEKDEKLYYNLIKNNFFNSVEVVCSDFLNFDLEDLKKHNQKIIVIANLPYNISTVILFKLFNYSNLFSEMFLMFQKEVAERIVSKNNCKKYGKLTVMSNIFSDSRIEFTIPPEAFSPKPKIESSVVNFKILDQPRFDFDKNKVEKTLNILFAQRRKTINAILKNAIKEKNIIEKTLQDLQINGSARPENLTLEDFISISKIIF